MGLVSKNQERTFEKRHILRQQAKYLATNVVDRVRSDPGYRAKLRLMEEFLRGHPGGLVLDVGSNTSGEAEYLRHLGHSLVASDINEVALGLSKKRAASFGRVAPEYIAADAHCLPFDSGTFGSVIAFEVLHHFEQLDLVLAELYRVLAPGGRLFAYEPYALNPYRRLAELRFLALGSIERSFTVRGLRKHLETAGFEVSDLRRHVLAPSEWKKNNVSRPRAFLKDLYYSVSRVMPRVFGNICTVARKDGHPPNDLSRFVIESRLRCPITYAPLRREADCLVTAVGESRYRYPLVDGIPVLIPEDAEPVPLSDS